MTWRLPDTYHSAGNGQGTATLKFYEGRDNLELGVQDHLCWVHGDGGDYRLRLSEFFREGLERGLRVAYLGSGDAGELRELLGGVADTGTLLSREAVRVISFEEFYGAAEPVDPAAVIKRYDAATQEALADGYGGLRVSADVTDLVRAPERRDAFARCEFLLERYSARHPLSAMCGYPRELGDAVTQFACLHAAVPAGLTPFQVFACDDGAVGLLGEFDQACQGAFERALGRIEPAPGDPGLIFDMSAVGFMDQYALLSLDSYAEACQVPVVARSVPPAVRRVAQVLGLEHLGHVHLGGL
jgi:anti-anti-sigma regulatory factor